MAPPEISLSVNGSVIPLHPFAREYIDQVISGILATLKESGQIKVLNLSIIGDRAAINLNNNPVSLNPFVNRITRNTVIGMVSALKGVGEIENLEINIKR